MADQQQIIDALSVGQNLERTTTVRVCQIWMEERVVSYQTPEGKVKARGIKIYEQVSQLAKMFWYPVQQSGGSIVGIPDHCLIIEGVPVYIEYKADLKKNRPTARQLKVMAELRRAGAVTLLVDEKGVEYLYDDLIRVYARGKLIYKEVKTLHNYCEQSWRGRLAHEQTNRSARNRDADRHAEE